MTDFNILSVERIATGHRVSFTSGASATRVWNIGPGSDATDAAMALALILHCNDKGKPAPWDYIDGVVDELTALGFLVLTKEGRVADPITATALAERFWRACNDRMT